MSVTPATRPEYGVGGHFKRTQAQVRRTRLRLISSALPTPVRDMQHIRPSARELFPSLRERLLLSRPIWNEGTPEQSFGKPMFRNKIDEHGTWV